MFGLTPLKTASVLAFAFAMLIAPAGADKPLDIYWPDVEGGGAVLIVTPAQESILIDAGNYGGRDPERIFKLVQMAKLKKIDYLIVTHFHDDHYGGAAELSRLVPIVHVYDNGLPDYKG